MISVLLLLVATVYLIAGILFFGKKRKTYSHLRHTISELGESGSPYEKPVSFGLFFIVGAILILVSLLNDTNETLHGLSLCVGAGYLVAAIFPCDEGSPLEGSWKQQIHNLGGFVEYAGSAYFLAQSAEVFSFVSTKLIAGIIVLCTLFISIPSFSFRGLVQRVAEALLFLSLIALTL
ncbi:MAG: hypothetical protein DI538_06970 [Azospira oryzae]|nr:MAG: hypothetical protein DI538_06970 [Azospira oryzae]